MNRSVMLKEAAYWIALAHLPGWGYSKINSLVVKFFHEQKISVEEFFQLPESEWKNSYQLDEKQIATLNLAKTILGSNAFLAESMSAQGFEIIPITSPEYSPTLKTNLKASHAPTILYVKGNKKLLLTSSVAIVGSRTASEKSLSFTDNVAKLATEQAKVVVSGFAKGIDKQALDSALQYNGQSIIVLPQGIMTFSSGFKQYYKQILSGDVLVLSTFFPKSSWKVELAMARNPIIYGLAKEIYVAESAEKGGTWSGVVDGFKKGRKIFVREVSSNEKNANSQLIKMGAIAVDFYGQELQVEKIGAAESLTLANENTASYITTGNVQKANGAHTISEKKNTKEKKKKSASGEQIQVIVAAPSEETIRSVLNGKPLSINELLNKLDLNWSVQKLTNHLKKLDFLEIVKEKNRNYYKLKGAPVTKQSALFF